jgi:hypothetical protein
LHIQRLRTSERLFLTAIILQNYFSLRGIPTVLPTKPGNVLEAVQLIFPVIFPCNCLFQLFMPMPFSKPFMASHMFIGKIDDDFTRRSAPMPPSKPAHARFHRATFRTESPGVTPAPNARPGLHASG